MFLSHYIFCITIKQNTNCLVDSVGAYVPLHMEGFLMSTAVPTGIRVYGTSAAGTEITYFVPQIKTAQCHKPCVTTEIPFFYNL